MALGEASSVLFIPKRVPPEGTVLFNPGKNCRSLKVKDTESRTDNDMSSRGGCWDHGGLEVVLAGVNYP